MSWNYRVIEFVEEHPEYKQTWRAIHEVYYDEDGKPEFYSENPAGITWLTTDDLDFNDYALLSIDRMKSALEKPVLFAKDFEVKK